MIKLLKLYSHPEIFLPIQFESGLNLIVGEKSEGSNKTNGVGKSICIEFLNYCLLKKYSDSRVSLIPKNLIASNVIVLLDFEFNGVKTTISRGLSTPEKISISRFGREIHFESLEAASEYLSNIYFEKYPAHTERISFRNLLAPIIRDERSEFKDIIKTYDTDSLIPRDFKPHLFYLGFGLELYFEISKIILELQQKTKYLTEITKLLTQDRQIKVSDAKARLNELESEVSKINASLEQLRNNDSFELVQNELISLDAQLKEIREQQNAIKFNIKQIDILPQPENINEFEMSILFNQFKDGLGDMVKKSLEEVKQFRDKIDNFRNTIVHDNLVKLRTELQVLNEKARKLDENYSQKLSLLDNGELLGNLKSAIKIFNEKNIELSTLRTLIDQYNQADKAKKQLTTKKSSKISEFDLAITTHEMVLNSFEQTILDIHEKIIGNRQAHFEITTKSNSQSKEFLTFDLRTDDDHSWSTERIKVFIYDTSLMFNEFTRTYHPLFLVHDNLFNVDNDSLEKSLNFMYHQELNRADEFQYILTINRDMVEAMEEKRVLNFNVKNHIRARFTKADRFLKVTKYNEVSKRKY
ncbi:DUF2326 domain-containing protein [Pedobacter sp. HMF7647]|uniref:DUF2326 domain-containing protein n=1 Tax=Hufsiella arboris TaxID=2695275 RepID=A0A7K1Y4L2_9SPHI|nr:DUF2326 domain-containing protein [Hufsiella arboris]MXV49513.1 DUF2326 domain-containing protein [Hufsiella arboris]